MILGLYGLNIHMALIILPSIRSNETNMEHHKEAKKNIHVTMSISDMFIVFFKHDMNSSQKKHKPFSMHNLDRLRNRRICRMTIMKYMEGSLSLWICKVQFSSEHQPLMYPVQLLKAIEQHQTPCKKGDYMAG